LHPAAERGHHRIPLESKVGEFQNVVNHARAIVDWHRIQRGEVIEVLPHLHVVIETKEVRHVADAPAYLQRLLHDVKAVQPRCPVGGLQQGRQHLDRGRLARPVTTDESENVPRLKRKGHVGNGRKRTVVLVKILDFEHEIRGI